MCLWRPIIHSPPLHNRHHPNWPIPNWRLEKSANHPPNPRNLLRYSANHAVGQPCSLHFAAALPLLQHQLELQLYTAAMY